MNDIRKISIVQDYKNNAMHYIVNQEVLNGHYTIYLIKKIQSTDSIKIYIENKENEIFLWKEFNNNMPVSIEYNLFFK